MTDSDQRTREAAENYFAAWERWDLDTVGTFTAENAVDERPQSGERFVGRSMRRCQGRRGYAGEAS